MNLKDYTTKKYSEQEIEKKDWKRRADAAVEKCQSFLINLLKRQIDYMNSCEKIHRLSTEYESHVIGSVPLISIRYSNNAAYSNQKPHFDDFLNNSDEYRQAMVIRVNTQEEADYCTEKMKKFLLSEGIKIIKCAEHRPGFLIKNKECGYTIWYSLEW